MVWKDSRSAQVLEKVKFLHGKLLIMKFLYKLTTVRDISAGDM
jgi:hypothetical protein